MSFKRGDVVMLKSGGPKMTVYHIYNNNEFVKVDWYEEGKISTHEFHQDQLKLIEE